MNISTEVFENYWTPPSDGLETHLHVLHPNLDLGANFRGFFLQAWLAFLALSSLLLVIVDLCCQGWQ